MPTLKCEKDFFRDIVRSAHFLRTHDDFIDVTFHCDGGAVHAHKVMLINESSFLSNLFKISAEKQSPSAPTEISLPGVRKPILTKLVQYLYQGQTTIKSAADKDEFMSVARTLDIILNLEDESPVDSEDGGETNNPEPSSPIPKPIPAKKVVKKGGKKSKKGAVKKYDDKEQEETEDQKGDNENRDGTSSPQNPQQKPVDEFGKEHSRYFVSAMKDCLKVDVRNCTKDTDGEVLKYYSSYLSGSTSSSPVPQLAPNPLFDDDEDMFANDDDDLIFEPSKPDDSPKVDKDDSPMETGRKRKTSGRSKSQAVSKKRRNTKEFEEVGTVSGSLRVDEMSTPTKKAGKLVKKTDVENILPVDEESPRMRKSSGRSTTSMKGKTTPENIDLEGKDDDVTGTPSSNPCKKVDRSRRKSKVQEKKETESEKISGPKKASEKKKRGRKSVGNKKTKNISEEKEEEDEDNDEDDVGGIEEVDYEVEKVVDKQGTGKNLLYLVKWKGWELPEDQTWEPLENLENAKHLVTVFENSLKKKPEIKVGRGSKKSPPEKTDSTAEGSEHEDEKDESEDESEAVLMCPDCLLIIVSKKGMKRHKENCKKQEPSSTQETETNNSSTSEKNMAVCFKCLIEYSKVSDLKNHLLDHFKKELRSKLPNKKPWTCPTCSKKMSDVNTLVKHFAYDHKEILKYCTADEIEGKPGGAKNGVERLVSKSPSPEKSRTHKMNISFSDSEDDETEIEDNLKNVAQSFDDLFGSDISEKKVDNKIVFNKDSDESDDEEETKSEKSSTNVDELLTE